MEHNFLVFCEIYSIKSSTIRQHLFLSELWLSSRSWNNNTLVTHRNKLVKLTQSTLSQRFVRCYLYAFEFSEVRANYFMFYPISFIDSSIWPLWIWCRWQVSNKLGQGKQNAWKKLSNAPERAPVSEDLTDKNRFIDNRWKWGHPRKAQWFSSMDGARFSTSLNAWLHRGYYNMGLATLSVNTVCLQMIALTQILNFFWNRDCASILSLNTDSSGHIYSHNCAWVCACWL